MFEELLVVPNKDGEDASMPLTWVHTLVIGSGASGLSAAVQLHTNGIEDVLILTEGLGMGTSINTGSDKQTYYKLSMCGNDADSPQTMAETIFGEYRAGSRVNLEVDVIARYLERLIQGDAAARPGGLSLDTLAENGFLDQLTGKPE